MRHAAAALSAQGQFRGRRLVIAAVNAPTAMRDALAPVRSRSENGWQAIITSTGAINTALMHRIVSGASAISSAAAVIAPSAAPEHSLTGRSIMTGRSAHMSMAKSIMKFINSTRSTGKRNRSPREKSLSQCSLAYA